MATFYARREGPIYENGLRWGFIVIGAASLMDAFHTWTGPEEDLPFGVQEGTLSDPSQMVQTYGWTIQFMIQQYVRLAMACFVVLAAFYVVGIMQARKAMLRTTETQRNRETEGHLASF
jgi:heme exporter protein D